MSSSIFCMRLNDFLQFISLKKSFTQIYFTLKQFYFKYNCQIILFIILFDINQLKTLWKKTFQTIHQLSCFVGHPVGLLKCLSKISPFTSQAFLDKCMSTVQIPELKLINETSFTKIQGVQNMTAVEKLIKDRLCSLI